MNQITHGIYYCITKHKNYHIQVDIQLQNSHETLFSLTLMVRFFSTFDINLLLSCKGLYTIANTNTLCFIESSTITQVFCSTASLVLAIYVEDFFSNNFKNETRYLEKSKMDYFQICTSHQSYDHKKLMKHW